MSEVSTLFIASVQEAVQMSVQSKKPLLVFISDDTNDSNDFFDKYLGNQDLYDRLRPALVCLKLVKGTQECGFFEQIFPNTFVPSFYVIREGNLIEIFHGDITLKEFKERFERIVNHNDTTEQQPTTQNQSNIQHHASTASSTSSSISTSQAHTYSNSARSTDRESTSAIGSTTRAPSSVSPYPASTSPNPSKRPTNDLNPNSQEKEVFAASAAKRHREEARKQKLLAQEEKHRILRLLEADKEERRLKEKTFNEAKKSRNLLDPESGKIETEEIVKKVRNTQNYTKCILAIRLFDGTSLRHDFKTTETLNDVRKWIDENRSDGDDPYSFHRAIPRTTFGDSEEFQTLLALNLAPRSALILKPVTKNVTDSYQNEHGWLSSSLSKIGGVLSSFISYGYHDEEQNNDLEGESHDQTRELIDSSRSASPNSVVGITPPIFLVNSSNLNSNPSLLNLNNQAPSGSNNTGASNIQDESAINRSGTPRPVNSANSSQSRVRTIYENEEHKDNSERLTYNGNHISLEDKKKK